MAQTESNSCNKFNFFEIVTIKKRIWGRSYESILSLRIETLLEFLILVSKLFHSIIADGKKEFLKNLYFV